MANKRVTRAVYAAFLALAAAFIASSVVQIASAVFRSTSGGPRRASTGCAEAITRLTAAVERARSAASVPAGGDPAQRYAEAKQPEWGADRDGLTRHCDADPVGPDALAALARLDRAAEASVHRQTAELAPVRREVDSFIR